MKILEFKQTYITPDQKEQEFRVFLKGEKTLGTILWSGKNKKFVYLPQNVFHEINWMKKIAIYMENMTFVRKERKKREKNAKTNSV